MMKRLQLVLLGALGILVGCSNENYKNGVEAFEYRQYNKAYKAFSQVDKSFGKYDQVTKYMETVSTKLDSAEYDKLKMAVRLKRKVAFFEESLQNIEQRKKWGSPYYDSVKVIREKMAAAVTDTIKSHFTFIPNIKASDFYAFCDGKEMEKENEQNLSSKDFFSTFIRREIDIFDKKYDLNQVKIPSSGWLETRYVTYINKVKVKVLLLTQADSIGKIEIEFFYNDNPPIAAKEAAKFLPQVPKQLFENQSICDNMVKGILSEKSYEYISSDTDVKYNLYASAFPGHFTVVIDPYGYKSYKR